jgi:hypothetical protein
LKNAPATEEGKEGALYEKAEMDLLRDTLK